MSIRILFVILFLAGLAVVARGDTLVLKDGRTFEGQVSETGNQIGVITRDGVLMFSRDEVARVDRDALSSAPAAVRDAFVNLKRTALRQETTAQAIALWEQYIASHADGPLLPRARAELAAIRQAEADGLVLWAGKIMKPEREKARHETGELLDAAVALYHAHRFAEAEKKLARAESLWPDHPTVDFYQGLTLRELRRPTDAAQRFVYVFTVLPEHVPSLNNAAVLCVQSTDYVSGAKFMARALQREPRNETLLDNAWEILNKLETDKRGIVVRLDFYKVAKDDLRTLREACAAQQERRLAADGTVRWGSKWIPKAEYDGYVAEQQEIDRQVKEREARVRVLTAQMTALSDRIQKQEQMRDAAVQAGTPASLQMVYPINQQIKELTDGYDVLQRQGNDIVRDIADLMKKRPGPKWTGLMSLLDAACPTNQIAGGQATDDEALHKAFTSGRAALVADDGTPLGQISADRHEPRSIWDPLGRFGSPYSKLSIFDPTSPFGDTTSDTSPWNPGAMHPPRIMLDGRQLFYLTANPALVPGISVPTLVQLLKSAK